MSVGQTSRLLIWDLQTRMALGSHRRWSGLPYYERVPIFLGDLYIYQLLRNKAELPVQIGLPTVCMDYSCQSSIQS